MTTPDVQARPLNFAIDLSPRAEASIRRVSTFTVIVLAAAAAVLSYAGLTQLAITAQIHPRLTWLLPVVVDGLTLVGGMQVLHSTLTGLRAWYGWLLTLLGVGASVVGNVAASPVDPMSRAVHAAPPIVLALALEALLRVYRHRVTQAHRAQIYAVEHESMPALFTPAPTRVSPVEAVTVAIPVVLPPRAVEPATTPPVVAYPVAPPGVARPAATPVVVRPVVARPAVTVPVAARPATTVSAPAADDAFDVTTLGVAAGAPMKERVGAVLAAHPAMSGGQIARLLGSDKSYTNKLIRELRSEAASAPSVRSVSPPATPALLAPAPATHAPAVVPVVVPAPAPVAPSPVAPAMEESIFSAEMFDTEMPPSYNRQSARV